MDEFTFGTSVGLAMMGRPLTLKTLRVFKDHTEIEDAIGLSDGWVRLGFLLDGTASITPYINGVGQTPLIPVPRGQLMQLIELAEDCLYIRNSEFSNPPIAKDRELMLSLYRLVGKEVPPYFSRDFGWRLD